MLSAVVFVSLMSGLTAQAPAAPEAAAVDSGVQAQVESLYAEGAALYKAGKYRPAIEKFEQAYALYPEPNLLYNLGRAYEALGEIDQAMLKYRLCSTHPQSAPDVAAKARDKLAVLEAAQATSNATPAGAPARTSSSSPTPAGPAAEPPPPAGFPVLGTLGAVVAVAGVGAAVAGGVLFGVGAGSHGEIDAAKASRDANGVSPITRVEAERLAADGTSQKTTGVILLCVGGGLALASIPLFAFELAE